MRQVINLGTIRYSKDDRKRLHSWMRRVEPSGFVGMVPKVSRLKPPETHPIFEMLTIIEEDSP